MGLVSFYSIGIFVVSKLLMKEKRIILRGVVILLGTLVIAAPWLVKIIKSHGMMILQSFRDSGFLRGEDILKFILLQWTGEVGFPIFPIFALIGICRSLNKRMDSLYLARLNFSFAGASGEPKGRDTFGSISWDWGKSDVRSAIQWIRRQ